MNNISKIKLCCGCMACVDRCPKACISTKRDTLGHIYPQVDETVCIECGACINVCQKEKNISLTNPIKTIAAWHKTEEQRLESSSGGIATAISEHFIHQEYIVYGCAFEPPFHFKHIRCTDVQELIRLKGSKYVQSDTTGVYKKIRQDLKQGSKVLFIGTPCQVAGVKRYFKKSKNLYTIDLICHGVPSIHLLKDSLPVNLMSLGVTQVGFRTSTKFCLSMWSGVENVFRRPLNRDLFFKGFFTGLFYRESCYSCHFACKQRVGDITLGDFWGINLKSKQEIEKGISLCLVNTVLGETMMSAISDRTIQLDRSIEEAIIENQQLQNPVSRSLRTRIFHLLYPILGFKWSVCFSIPEIVIKNKLLSWISSDQ